MMPAAQSKLADEIAIMMNGAIVEPVSVVGSSLPLNMPINSFGPSDLPDLPVCVFDNLQAAGFCEPTVLERSAVPVGLAGRDMVIVAGDHDMGQPSSLVISLVAPLVNQMFRAGAKKVSKLEGSSGAAKCCPQVRERRKRLRTGARRRHCANDSERPLDRSMHPAPRAT